MVDENGDWGGRIAGEGVEMGVGVWVGAGRVGSCGDGLGLEGYEGVVCCSA